MRNFIKPPFRSRFRIKIPFLIDIVWVADPEQITKIQESGDVDRLHVNGAAALPFWIRFFFKATRFWDPEHDLWFLSLESANAPGITERRDYLSAQVAKWYTTADIQKIAELLRANASDESLAYAIAQIVNVRFFGEEIPLSVTRAAGLGLEDFNQALLPWKYFRARCSQKVVVTYCRAKLATGVHPVDVGHNIGEAVETTAVALRRLKDNLDMPVEDIFTQQPLTAKVPRIAVKSSRIGGLFLLPIVAGKTIFIFQIEKAAAKSKNILFTFGTGTDDRSCIFKDFFLCFMKDLQKELRKGTPPSSAAA